MFASRLPPCASVRWWAKLESHSEFLTPCSPCLVPCRHWICESSLRDTWFDCGEDESYPLSKTVCAGGKAGLMPHWNGLTRGIPGETRFAVHTLQLRKRDHLSAGLNSCPGGIGNCFHVVEPLTKASHHPRYSDFVEILWKPFSSHWFECTDFVVYL